MAYSNRAFWEIQEPAREAIAAGWWTDPKDKDDEQETKARADSLVSCARYIENLQRDLHEQNLWNAQLYSNRELAAFDWGQGSLYRASLAPVSRVGENLTLTVVDTLVSQVGKNRPKATPVTRGASWKVRLQAKKLDKFLYGEFIRNRVYDKGKQIFRDACVFGLGVLHVYVEEDNRGANGGVGARVCIDRVFPDEIIVDQVEVVATGKVRHLYRRRVLPAEVVAATYKVPLEKLLEGSKGATYLDYRPIGQGWVVLVEGWQLGGEYGQPGRYMAACPGVVLDDKPWDYDWVPFVFYHWQIPLAGFYSPSVVEQALPYQIRLNEVCEVIREAQDLMARPRIFVAEGSRVSPMELDNAIGRIIKYTGIKPESMTWDAVNAELYNERDRCWSQCLAAFGLSQMASTAQPPPGVRFDSSKGLREFNSIQDDRLADPSQRLERMYMDLAEMIVKVIKAYKGGGGQGGLKTTWYSGGKRARAEVIDWSAIDLDDNAYVLQLEASSVYNMTPAAQQDEISTALAQGRISPDEFKRLMSHPDTDGENSIAAAAAADIDRVIEMLEDGQYEEPTGVQDLVQGVQRVTLAYLALGRYENVPDDVKLAFIDWITAARAELERGTEDAEPPPSGMQPAAPPGAGPPGMGPGMPSTFSPPIPMHAPGMV